MLDEAVDAEVTDGDLTGSPTKASIVKEAGPWQASLVLPTSA